MNKRLTILLTCMSLTLGIGGVAIYATTSALQPNETNANEYTINIDSNTLQGVNLNSYSSKKGSEPKAKFRYTEFAFLNVMKTQTGTHDYQMKNGKGEIYNTTENSADENFKITGFKTISIVGDGSMTAYFGHSSNAKTKSKTLNTNGTTDISAFADFGYITIASDTFSHFDSISITYSCFSSSGGETVDPEPGVPGEWTPKSMKVTQNKTDYIFGETIDFNSDVSVKVIDKNNQIHDVSYDPTKKAGFYVSYSFNDANDTGDLTTPLTYLGNYAIVFGFTKNGKTVESDGEFILVHGGSFTDAKPTTMDVTLSRGNYQVGETLKPSDFIVKASWPDYGGEELVAAGDGTNGFKVTSTTFNVNDKFNATGSYTVTVIYRGLSQDISFKVEAVKRSAITYDYNDYFKDGIYNLACMPTTGNTKALVVPVWFNDSISYIKTKEEKDQIKKDIEIAYFGDETQTGWESVTTYYEKDSYNQLHISGKVTDWYNANTLARQTNGDDTVELVKKVGNWCKTQLSKAEYDSYDTDKDGYIDAIILIYAFPNHQNHPVKNDDIKDPEKDSVNDNLWAYCFWVQDESERNINNPGVNTFFWASYDFMYSGLRQGNPMKIDAHTYIHEMGHILGLEDYYDYNGKTNPAGGFSMQDANVGIHDPFSKLAYGWLDPIVPTETTTITINAFESSGDVILLTPEFHNSAFDEYILLEYFTPTGLNYLDTHYQYEGRYPSGTKLSGLRVWHVNARLLGFVERHGELDCSDGYYNRMSPGLYGVSVAATNTTPTGNPEFDEGYVAMRIEDQKFDMLALLNQTAKNAKNPYGFIQDFNSNHLWRTNDTFSMVEYKYSFPNVGKLDSGLDLGFTFKVVSMNDSTCTIDVTKL